MRISDWSSDVCSSDLRQTPGARVRAGEQTIFFQILHHVADGGGREVERRELRQRARSDRLPGLEIGIDDQPERSEEHTSELQSLMRISYAVFCLQKQTTKQTHKTTAIQHHNTK